MYMTMYNYVYMYMYIYIYMCIYICTHKCGYMPIHYVPLPISGIHTVYRRTQMLLDLTDSQAGYQTFKKGQRPFHGFRVCRRVPGFCAKACLLSKLGAPARTENLGLRLLCLVAALRCDLGAPLRSGVRAYRVGECRIQGKIITNII